MRRLAVGLLALAFAGAAARGESGTSAAPFLRIANTARPVGMGGAYTGVAEGIYSLGYNPAGLSTIEQASVVLTHNEMLLNIDYDYLAVGHRFHPRSVWALSFTRLGAKDTRRNAAGAVIGEFTNSDIAGALSFAHAPTDALALGVTGRYFKSKLDSFSATAFGFDAGIRYRVREIPGVTLGAAVHNLGTDVTFLSTGAPQPWTIRLGSAWRGFQERILVASDIEVDRESVLTLHTGLEGRIAGSFFARIGGTFRQEAEIRQILRAGLGVATSVGDLDYAYESFGENLESNHRITYAYHWGRARPAEERPNRSRGVFSRTEESAGPGYAEEQVPDAYEIRDRRIPIALDAFVNLTGDPALDWVEPSLVAIAERAIERTGDLRRVSDANEAKFRVNGRFARSGETIGEVETLWVSVRLFDDRGRLVDSRDGLVYESDLIRGAEAVLTEVLLRIPRTPDRSQSNRSWSRR